ncbi:MAG: hypothetical protein GYB66_11640 [Chloroflexi bacterium]|nr:hypothetical protein [Chloroflexota bacterium]
MEYHLAETVILKETTIVRQRSLPPRAYGEVQVSAGAQVNWSKVVASGSMPRDYSLIDIAAALGIDPEDSENLAKVIELVPGDEVTAGMPLAKARRRRERKRIPKAPADGFVNLIERGRIILQVNPEPVEVRARIPGTVTALLGEDEDEPRGVEIQSAGTLIQCAWGNGQFNFGPYSLEPSEGLVSLRALDSLLENLRGRIYVLQRPLQGEDLVIAVEKELGGLVAPSMPHYLRETALMLKVPIILTEGFGDREPTPRIYDLLTEFENTREGTFDATMPARWHHERPEIVLPVSLRDRPPEPISDEPLSIGATVRIRREPYAGQIAQVRGIPEALQVIENGLHVRAAQVKLRGGKNVMIPLANLELLGESSDK